MMGRSPASCEEGELKKGPWTPEEDKKLVDYIRKHGHGCWRALPKNAGINRCGKSCRLRWTNYLRPDIKRGKFSKEEEDVIISIHSVIGNKWSAIASHLPGRTDNEIKNYWNTHLRKKLFQMGIDPITHRPRTDLSINNNLLAGLPQLLAVANLFSQLDSNNALSLLHYPSNHATHQQLLATNEVNSLLQLLHTSAHHNPPHSLSGTSSAFQGQRAYMDLINMKSQLDQGMNDATLFNTLNNLTPSFELPSLEDHQAQQKQEYTSMHGATRNFGCNMSSNYQIPSNLFSVENPAPSLMSSSPKNHGVHNNNFNNLEEIIGTSNPTSASTTCEAWAEFMDDGPSDSYWKDIEQASSLHGLLR